MNIAFLSAGALRNPKESAHITTMELAKAIIAAGHTVVIITSRIEGMPVKDEKEGVLIYRSHFPFLSKLLSHPFGLRTVQKELGITFDIIHSFSATPLFVLSGWLAKLFSPQAKVIHTLKSYSKRKGNLYPLLNLADAITVPTAIFADKLTLVRRQKIKIIHSPLRSDKFLPQDKVRLKKKLGFKGKKIILYYGGMWDNKGINVLLKAMPLITKNNSDLLMLCAPRYNQIEEQQRLVKELKMENNVRFIIEDIPIEDYAAMADIIALPYKSLIGTEGNPSCVLEAMACKTTVVTTDLPELREIAEGCVLFAKPNDVNSLAKTIDYALNDDNSEMIEKAYQKSLEFDVKRIGDDFVTIYNKN
ncbi:MAG: glycosyltransferase family 4 protein [Nanoarchaeota archaeon]|nr:glycosyltransferase family 4 protein [Nanoarchaeota archaeon]